MQDPFRPNSNAQLMREAQVGLIVVGLLLCVLVYVAFHRLTNRSTRYDEISRNVPVAEAVDGDPYPARSLFKFDQQPEARRRANKTKPLTPMETLPTKRESDALEFRQSPPSKKVAQALRISPQPTEELQKVRPPVLKSEFGGPSKRDFLPVAIAKENETKNEFETKNQFSGFSLAPSLPSKLEMSSASKIPAKPKSPVPEKIDAILKRQLASAARIDQSNSFVPDPIAPQQQNVRKKSDSRQPQKAPLIAQTSAIEPLEPTATAAMVPAKKSPKKPAKASKNSKRTYTMREGDSLWTIAQAVYGDGRYFRALHRVNEDTLTAAGSLSLGTTIIISTKEELQRDHPELCPKEDKNYRPQQQPNASDIARTRDQELRRRFYVTEDGDTLFGIARQRFGQASRYLEIYELNRFRIPETANHLTPLGGGIELLLPN